MVLRPQAKTSIKYYQMASGEKIKPIFSRHLLLEKKSHPAAASGHLHRLSLLSGTSCSSKQFFNVEATC